MSEFLPEGATVNVFDVDPNEYPNPADRKAILAMQATGLHVAGDDRFAAANKALHVAAQNIGRPPTMTYEDLVFNNPVLGTTRVLSTNPTAAQNEANFYRGHRRIETRLYRAIDLLVEPDKQVESAPVEELKLAVAGVAELHRSLDPASFSAFRPYFIGLNGYPGASGLYSESIPILDLLVHGGSNITPQERRYMLTNVQKGLYPNQAAYGELHKNLLLADNPELRLPTRTRAALVKQLNNLRHVHGSSVKKFVPEALQGTADGSGGIVNVAGYLATKIVDQKGETS